VSPAGNRATEAGMLVSIGPVATGGAPRSCPAPAERPARTLQPLGEGDEALTSKHHFGMLPAREGQPKMVQAVRQRYSGDGHPEVAGVGEVRKALLPWSSSASLPGASAASPNMAPRRTMN
jgi:hypothetical protein